MHQALKIALVGCALTLSAPWASAAEMGAVDEPIKLAINEWTGQHITTQITGKILEAAGYKVEYIVAGYQNMWQAMSEGQLDAAMEVWASNRALRKSGNTPLVSEQRLVSACRRAFASCPFNIGIWL